MNSKQSAAKRPASLSRLYVLLAFGAVAIAASSLGSAQSTSPPGQRGSSATPAVTRVGSLTLALSVDASSVCMYAAAKEGFFDRNGVDANVLTFPTGPAALEAVLSNRADMTQNGQYPLPVAVSKGAKIKAIAQISTSGLQNGIVGNADIKKPSDLQGQKIGVPLNSTAEYFFHLYAQHHHLDLNKLTIANVSANQSVTALLHNDIQAFSAWDPFIERATRTVKGAHVLARSKDDGIMLLRSYAEVTPRIVDDPPLARAIVKALIQSGDWCNKHHPELISLLVNDFKQTQEDAALFVSEFDYSANFDAAARDELSRVSKFLKDNNKVPTVAPLADMYTTTFMQAVDPSRI